MDAKNKKRFLVTQIELVKCKHEVYHWLHLPQADEPDFYRQTTSYNGFFHNTRNQEKKWGNWCQPGFLFTSQREDEVFKTHIEKGVPQLTHKSLWLFYHHIGYDYKKKKAVRPINKI